MKKEFSRVFIKDTVGDILVIRDRKGMWNFPGGKREIGESAVECAIREVQEETALTISDLEEIYTGDFLFEGVEWRGSFYFAKRVSGLPTLNEPNKIKGIQFIEDLNVVNFSSGLQTLLADIAEKDILGERVTHWG
ncbi:8-oxo-dGTP diphosphatase [Enterococcus sp. PF1-24]|uniref:NUDIX domain-containing protein n=1 Tax=unclassified Enterococcus TaxID=2608891 RepID=UPI0024756711|nr:MULTISPECIES: NUDIX hydrolase [unclassified Enterococcus]MDH6365681.1 8-oxo-dGTP diphosphatase [Enterococcus sp. PFB1-1]MDH6402793.1 8-oxo-dGTP diphosphatase [Enterococcus sp. PF1-24]